MKRVLALLLVLGAPSSANAVCRVVEVTFTPTSDLQLAVWLEDSAGNFVDTVLVTQETATYGLGNRPGIMEFNSELDWPYGRRESVLPVWAYRRGAVYPQLVFQDGQDDNLSHAIIHSSQEFHFCRPMTELEADTGSCASPGNVFTDKGRFSATETTPYPPRADLTYAEGIDHPDVAQFPEMNDLDAVSRATPIEGMPYTLRFALPPDLPDGDYVIWVEASKEFDQNGFYAYPSPVGIPWSQYGVAYRGQPSIVWQVPFVLDAQPRAAISLDYAGYGDPDGADSTLAPPDSTITEDVEGSGAQRLLLASSPEGMYRVRVTTSIVDDTTPPDAPASFEVLETTHERAAFRFLSPEDTNPAGPGMVVGYEVRYLVGTPITEDNFATGILAADSLTAVEPGLPREFELDELNPETHYYVGVRALDGCLNPGPIAVAHAVTGEAPNGEVDACFVATAAWGSPLEGHVARLRAFRDAALRRQALGELFVEVYYTFGPAFAEVIEPSDDLRSVTRVALQGIVDLAESW
jgi:hypothetical protein